MPKVEMHIVKSTEKPGGIGEPGMALLSPTVANAVFDALRPLGIHQLDFPYSPDRVWSAIHGRG